MSLHDTLMDKIRNGVSLKPVNNDESVEKITRKISVKEATSDCQHDVLMKEIRNGVKLKSLNNGKNQKVYLERRKITSPPPCMHDLLMKNIRAGVTLRQVICRFFHK